MSRWARRALKGALALLCVVLGGLLVMAWNARSMRALEPWHERVPEGEFRRVHARDGFAFEDLLELEARLFTRQGEYASADAAPGERRRYHRYTAGGPHDPATLAPNWNRTFERAPASAPRGGFLLLHGLTDSPYSMRSLAELLVADGHRVLALRLPGHGIAPAGLLDIEWEDWAAAVRLAVRHLRAELGPEPPLHICGYSTGGALAVEYALEALRDPTLPRPARLVLLSPSIGVTAFARLSNWHRVFSWIPAFEKSRWLSIDPEVDPWKFSSFPKNAGAQVWRLSERVQAGLDELAREGRTAELPPVLAFQSVVDATILAGKLYLGLFERLPANGSELVAFDVNRALELESFFEHDYGGARRLLESPAPLAFRFSLVTNASADSHALVELSRRAGEQRITTTPLELDWPRGLYSLSHVALPFPPDDPTYGIEPGEDGEPPLLGSLLMRGESAVLAIPADQRLRLRYNPFHDYVRDVLLATLAGRR